MKDFNIYIGSDNNVYILTYSGANEHAYRLEPGYKFNEIDVDDLDDITIKLFIIGEDFIEGLKEVI